LQDLQELEPIFNVFATPFAVNPSEAPRDMQVELIELQSDRELVEKYRMRKNLIDFYQGFSRNRLFWLHKNAAKVLSMFGTTYDCEQFFFSVMRPTKSKGRARLTDKRLFECLRVATSRSIVPNISRLVSLKRCQRSNARKK